MPRCGARRLLAHQGRAAGVEGRERRLGPADALIARTRLWSAAERSACSSSSCSDPRHASSVVALPARAEHGDKLGDASLVSAALGVHGSEVEVAEAELSEERAVGDTGLFCRAARSSTLLLPSPEAGAEATGERRAAIVCDGVSGVALCAEPTSADASRRDSLRL